MKDSHIILAPFDGVHGQGFLQSLTGMQVDVLQIIVVNTSMRYARFPCTVNFSKN